MTLTPVEIRHLSPPRTSFRGYKTAATDRLLEEIAVSFEDVWRERADLADKVEQLEADLVRFRELENLLRTTLVSAEQASAQMRAQARREAELILGEAHVEARKVQRDAFAENERLRRESKRMRAQLQDALSALDGSGEPTAAEARAEPPVQDTAAGEERSWYGRPDADAADADAA